MKMVMAIMDNWDIKAISGSQSILKKSWLKYTQGHRTEIVCMLEVQTFHGAHAIFAHQCDNYEKVPAVKNSNIIQQIMLLILYRA